MDETPKHKPSEKHALDDVLKSLQDMVRSELLPPDQSKVEKKPPSDPDVPRKRGRPRKELPPEPETPPVKPARGPISEYDAILSSLEELVARDLNLEALEPGQASPPPDADKEPEKAEIPTLVPLALAPAPAAQAPTPDNRQDTAKTARPNRPVPRARQSAVEPQAPAARDRDQHEFEFDLPVPEAAVPPASPRAGKTPAVQAANNRGSSPAPAESDVTETPAAAGQTFDDIPVLEDIAARPPRAFADFSPGEVRDAAVRVIARLNIELRRTGQPPLDARLIDRLQNLLGEELGRKSEK